MAAAQKSKTTSVSILRTSSKKRRPGVHSKKKTATSKHSKNYKKPYRGQGR
jgi:hypothetical protein